MKRFKNILFVADRQDGLTTALDRAVAVSQTNGARLTVMDVTPDSGLADYVKRTYAVDLNAQLREQRLQALEALLQPYTDAGLPLYSTVATGTRFIEVIRAVQRNGHDLVMKVAERDSGLAPALFSSTDMHLLRKCPCPVWIDRSTGTPSYQRLLAAVDPFDDESGGRGRIARSELERLLKDTETRHRQALDDLLLPYGLSTGSDNVRLLKGHPAQIISSCAAQRSADLVVMGTLGRVGVPGLFIGNTAEDVLRETQTAVLAVKPSGFVSPVQ